MKIVWQHEERILRPSLSLVQDSQRYDWSLRDVMQLELRLARFAAGEESLEQAAAPAGWSPRFELKPSDDRDGDPLAWVYDFVLSGSGSTSVYTGTLSLNTEDLITAVEA
jgi:hypothetical protein